MKTSLVFLHAQYNSAQSLSYYCALLLSRMKDLESQVFPCILHDVGLVFLMQSLCLNTCRVTHRENVTNKELAILLQYRFLLSYFCCFFFYHSIKIYLPYVNFVLKKIDTVSTHVMTVPTYNQSWCKGLVTHPNV